METPGAISHWNDDKGFGFIRPKAGGNEVFLHISAFRGDRRPQVGDQVSAQQVFRHKSRKTSYQVVFWLIVLVHLLGWALLVFLLLSSAR